MLSTDTEMVKLCAGPSPGTPTTLALTGACGGDPGELGWETLVQGTYGARQRCCARRVLRAQYR